MTPETTNQLATELLLTGLMSVLALGILASFSAMFLLRRRQTLQTSFLHKQRATTPFAGRYHPSVFENSCRWLVIKNTHLNAVQAALGLHNPIPCSWGEGLSRLTGRKLFVSPPVRGWILVIGVGLPDPVDDVDRCFHFLLKLSRTLGQVQFFSADRALNHHAWVRVEGGHIRRAYVWAGETLWNQGPPTREEVDLEMRCFGYGEKSFELPTPAAPTPNSEKVLPLAARWSFDPTSVDESMLRAGLGVAGDVGHLRPH